MQPDHDGTPVGSEDCLTLNVWTPAEPHKGPLPVLFFVHGGFEVRGTASLRTLGIEPYSGAAAAARAPAVVVTINYRLGPLGFLAHPGFAKESAQHAAGNYGLLDALAALGWVKRNIAAFGGDPHRVLLFGQSAGAYNTCALIASPLSRGLFSAAMMMSGGCSATRSDTARAIGTHMAHLLGCDGSDAVACMRGRSPSAVIAALPREYRFGGVVYGPAIDGWVLPKAPIDALNRGEHQHVPLIVGTTTDEMTTMLHHYAPRSIKDAADHQAALERFFGHRVAGMVGEVYASARFATPAAAFVAAASDATFACPARSIARGVSAAQTEGVWRYSFTHTFDSGPLQPFAAGHGLDLLFALHHPSHEGHAASTGEEVLADLMLGYVARFAATGDPNGAGAPAWPRYGAAELDLKLDAAPQVESGFRKEACDLWDRLEGGRAR
jgi:para-nitrobenzyl esterase